MTSPRPYALSSWRAACRALGEDCVTQLLQVALDHRRGDLGGADELQLWLLRQLSQAGPTPNADPVLYRELHNCLDEVAPQKTP